LNSLTTAPLGTELVKSQTSASVCGFNDIVIDRALIGFERQRIIVLLLKDLPGRRCARQPHGGWLDCRN
jgi:hypothetical protein